MFGTTTLVLAIAAAAARAQAPPQDIDLTETIEVHGRLGASEAGPASPPSRELAPETPEARSVPEALSRDVSIVSVDQVGNGRQLSIDLRGFSGAEGATALLLDGVRMNDADTNAASWELLRGFDVERVELAPGPRGASLGGGSLGGVVRVTRKRPTASLEGAARLRGGSFGFADAAARVSGPALGWKWLASADGFRDDGFRDGAASHERAFRVAADRDVGRVSLQLDLSRTQGRWRQPGALERDELDDDPTLSADNALDAQATTQDLLTSRLERRGARTRVVAAAGARFRRGSILTTGRSHYGFLTRDAQQSLTLACEAATTLRDRRSARLVLRWGFEAARERLHPRGFATDSVEDGVVSALERSSDVRVSWDRSAAFAGLDASWGTWGAELSVRHDASRVRRAGHELSSAWDAVSGSRRFGDRSVQLALGRRVEVGDARIAWQCSWGESFLAPSALQLFAYPGFYSNPDLEPQRGDGPQASLSVTRRGVDASLELYATRTRDEIAYDDAGRRNVNAGRTLRRGAELRVSWAATPRVRLTVAHALMDATYRGGSSGIFAKGARVPLVPRERTSVALDAGPWRGASVSLGLLRVGRAALSNDFDGDQPELRARSLVALTYRHDLPRARGVSLEVSADNLLDDRHPSRGIESWGTNYFTPAMPRTITFGVSWRTP